LAFTICFAGGQVKRNKKWKLAQGKCEKQIKAKCVWMYVQYDCAECGNN